MNKIILVIFCLVLLCSCNSQTTKTEKQDIKINLPTDDTVNGYRNNDYFSNDFIPQDEVSVTTPNNTLSYCGNKNSKVFHKSSCTSVKKTKEANKVYFADKDEYLENGYKPCQNCNP